MKARNDKIIKSVLSGSLCTLLMLFSAYAGMLFTGKLALQIILTFSFTLAFSFVADFSKIPMRILAISAGVSTAFWILYAVIAQMIAKGTFFIFSSAWQYMFYYDSIGMIFIVLIVVTAYQRIKAFRKKDAEITEQYEKFYSVISVVFTLFYIVVLVYCFFICRIPGGEQITPNFDPLDVIRATFMTGYLDYERLILFLGNIVIFVPLGYLLCHRLNKGAKRIILVFLPIILSSAIEFSQYYFGMGHPDIDDVILNVIGFYIGALLKIMFDKIFTLKR